MVCRRNWRGCSRSPAWGWLFDLTWTRLPRSKAPGPILGTSAASGRDPEALTRAADVLPIRGGAPSEAADLDPLASLEDDSFFDGHAFRPSASNAKSGSRVQVGAAKGRSIAIYGPKFVIGRDRSCHLRLGSAMVSKLHSAIELRDGRIFVRDLGSTNGTIVDGRTLRDAETELRDGDRIQIGPVVCTLAAGRDKAEPARSRR